MDLEEDTARGPGWSTARQLHVGFRGPVFRGLGFEVPATV